MTTRDTDARSLDVQEIARLLRAEGEEMSHLLAEARRRRVALLGNKVFFRGIVEFSNLCTKNCHYCGIRRDNRDVERFTMGLDEILAAARWAHERNYGSVVLQSGERQDERFVDLVDQALRQIRDLSGGRLGVTLSVGEQEPAVYRRWFESGAHRYLLRIETSSPHLYARLHPCDHSFEDRVSCLHELRRIGYQVGTGVMIGLPGQTVEDLARDVDFFRRLDVDMLGMGPYVVHSGTPLGEGAGDGSLDRQRRLELALKMIAVCRLVLPDVNIASTTALQALHPRGREMGLQAGANVIMPIITPVVYRKSYQLYDGKPCLDEEPAQCQTCLEMRIRVAGDEVGWGEWGDSPHALRRG